MVSQQPSLYGDCRVVLFIVKEEILRHPLQALAAGLDREVILGIVAEILHYSISLALKLLSSLYNDIYMKPSTKTNTSIIIPSSEPAERLLTVGSL